MIGESLVSSNEDGLDKLAKHARGVLPSSRARIVLASGFINGISTAMTYNELEKNLGPSSGR